MGQSMEAAKESVPRPAATWSKASACIPRELVLFHSNFKYLRLVCNEISSKKLNGDGKKVLCWRIAYGCWVSETDQFIEELSANEGIFGRLSSQPSNSVAYQILCGKEFESFHCFLDSKNSFTNGRPTVVKIVYYHTNLTSME